MAMTALEQELLRYLADRLTTEFGDHIERHRTTNGDASCGQHEKPLPVEQAFELRHWDDVDDEWSAPVICSNVLDVYRGLPAGLTEYRPKVLVIQGEPGSGKSFTMECLFCGLAKELLLDPGNRTLHVPLLLRLGEWTRPVESFAGFLARHWREGTYPLLARDWTLLRGQRPLLLLLDGRDEVPDGLELEKCNFLYDEVESQEAITAWAGLICSATTQLSAMNTLDLLPLPSEQVLGYLRPRATTRRTKPDSDIDIPLLPTAQPTHKPTYTPTTSHGMRPFMRLPYWLSMWGSLGRDIEPLSCNRHELIETYLADRHERGSLFYRQSHRTEQVPQLPVWTRALRALALTLVLPHSQAAWRIGHRLRVHSSKPVLCDAPTGMTRAQVEGQLPQSMLEFSLQVQVLRQRTGLYFFEHQLLQEVLAAGSLLSAWTADPQGASAFWPASFWWRCTGWERVAMITAQLLDGDFAAVRRFVFWLAQVQPEVALQAWHAAGRPPLGSDLLAWIRERWLPGMTDLAQWPAPAARATIGRAMAGFDLDDRPGIGLRPDGLPDIDWVEFNDGQPFVFQDAMHPGLPPFAISRYPITVRQYQVFVDASDGHVDVRWWHGIEQWQYQSFSAVPNDTSSPGEWRRYQETPRGILPPYFADTNCPRGDVTWYQAQAYCRWLSHRLGQEINLPSELQWERAARGRHGWRYPSSPREYPAGHMNCLDPQMEDSCCYGTSAVGIFPQGATPEGGVQDMAGNVVEWCLDIVERVVSDPEWADSEWHALRGGSWNYGPEFQDSVMRCSQAAEVWDCEYGFRVCR